MTNTRTITAAFETYAEAAAAVERLEAAGVPRADISLVSADAAERGRYDPTTSRLGEDDPSPGAAAGTGATVGTVLGGGAGLLAGLGLLAIPGLGPVVAAGWLASALVGAGIGAATGGTVGALTAVGVEDAHHYAESLDRGGTLVTVRMDEGRLSVVRDILGDEAADKAAREDAWRREGWPGNATPTDDYAPGTTGALSSGAIGAAASTTTGLGTGAPLGLEEAADENLRRGRDRTS